MRMLRFLMPVALVCALVGTNGRALAQQPYYAVDSGQGQTVTVSSTTFNGLVDRISALEAAGGGASQKDCKGDDGWEEVGSSGWKSKVGGRIMMDYWNWATHDDNSFSRFGDQQDYFEFRRLRIFLSGSGYGQFEYKLQVDFEPEVLDIASDLAPAPATVNDFDSLDFGTVAIKDIYLGMTDIPVIGKLRMGHFKVGFSLEELTSSKDITFMERSLPIGVFSPSRKVGIQAYNASCGKNVGWSYGIFFENINDDALELVDDNQGTIVAGRLFATPVYDVPSDGRYLLHVGIGGLYVDDQDDTVRFRARPEIHEGDRWVDSGNIALDEDYGTVNLEAVAVYGPFSLQAEWFAASVNADGVADDLEYYGAYVYASYFLTGESRPYKHGQGYFDSPKPYENFWIVPGCVGSGAWEIAARWSYLDLRDDMDPAQDDEAGKLNNFTLGVNWYWNDKTKLMFNYVHTNGSDYFGAAPNGSFETDGNIWGLSLRTDF